MSSLQRLVETIATLRSPGGCSWEREQTLSSIRPHLLKEVYEQLEVLAGDSERQLEELGEVLFIVLLLCQIGADEGRLDIETVAAQVNDKMIRRHPHVFGSPEERQRPEGAMARLSETSQRTSRLDGIPRGLPALLETSRMGEKVSAVGFDWSGVDGVLDKVREELAELEEALQTGEGIAEEYGDLLQSCAHVGRHIGAPPEAALRKANRRFSDRFRAMEGLAAAEGIELSTASAAALDALWERVKAGA